MDGKVFITLRRMSWERAKGELLSLLQTYYWHDKSYETMENKINNFIKDVEDNW